MVAGCFGLLSAISALVEFLTMETGGLLLFGRLDAASIFSLYSFHAVSADGSLDCGCLEADCDTLRLVRAVCGWEMIRFCFFYPNDAIGIIDDGG